MSAAIAGAAIGGGLALGAGASVATGIGLGATVGGLAGNLMGGGQAGAASSAADAQAQAALAGIQQQGAEFNTVQGLLAPYVQAGTNSLPGYNEWMGKYAGAVGGYGDILGQLNNLTGANGNPAQQAAITGLQSNPLYTNSMNLGQQAILANASATGGLRGGNTIASLGYLPGQVLSNVMQQQIGNLGTSLNGQQGFLNGIGNVVTQQGNLVNLGENAAAGTGQAAMQTGNNITSLIGQKGAINAGGILAGQNAITNGVNQLSGLAGSGGLNGLGNLSSLWSSGAGISNGTTPQDLIASYTG